VHNIPMGGAALYLPATHNRLDRVFTAESGIEATSFIVCTEDALAESDLDDGLKQIASLLPKLRTGSEAPRIFIRPRNEEVFIDLLMMKGIEKVDGFVIPKADTDSLPAYLQRVQGTSHGLMPVLETKEVFDEQGRSSIRRMLARPEYQQRITTLRIGGNDLLRIMGMKRTKGVSVYETPLGTLIAQIVLAFRPDGFHLTGVVCDDFEDLDLLKREVKTDILFGLCGKSAIHPRQVAVIESGFAISEEDLSLARSILENDQPAVFAQSGSMVERKVHATWAYSIMNRARLQSYRNKLSDQET
jgi:citrate lyase beta subunit